jgi:hypothetical protein
MLSAFGPFFSKCQKKFNFLNKIEKASVSRPVNLHTSYAYFTSYSNLAGSFLLSAFFTSYRNSIYKEAVEETTYVSHSIDFPDGWMLLFWCLTPVSCWGGRGRTCPPTTTGRGLASNNVIQLLVDAHICKQNKHKDILKSGRLWRLKNLTQNAFHLLMISIQTFCSLLVARGGAILSLPTVLTYSPL